MENNSVDSTVPPSSKASDVEDSRSPPPQEVSSSHDSSSKLSALSISSWAKNLKLPQTLSPSTQNSENGNASTSTFSRLTSGLGLHLSSKAAAANESAEDDSGTAQSGGVFESLTRGLVDSSLSAVKAVQVKARHMVSQNKRRYQVY